MDDRTHERADCKEKEDCGASEAGTQIGCRTRERVAGRSPDGLLSFAPSLRLNQRRDAARRYRTTSRLRDRLGRRLLRSHAPLDAKLLAQYLRALDAEGKQLRRMLETLKPPRSTSRSQPRKRRMCQPLQRARTTVPTLAAVTLPLEVVKSRLAAFLRTELAECTPKHHQPQPTLAELWQGEDRAAWRHAAAQRERVSNQTSRRCPCCQRGEQRPCTVSLAAVRSAFAKDDPMAAASLKEEGLEVGEMVRNALELPSVTHQRMLYGFSWVTPRPSSAPAYQRPDFEAVRQCAEWRQPGSRSPCAPHA